LAVVDSILWKIFAGDFVKKILWSDFCERISPGTVIIKKYKKI
jgi:hypothetical protein